MKNILYKELKELARDGRFKSILVLSLVLLVLASITSIQQFNRAKTQVEVTVAKERKIWETQEAKNPHAAAHYGTYAFKPIFPLSLIDSGVSQYTGNAIFLEAHSRNEASFSEAADRTSLGRFGNLSLQFILLYLFPLLLILIGYNTVTKEIEYNTIRLLKSQGVSSLKLVFGKWLAMLLPIVGIAAIVFLIVGGILSGMVSSVIFSWASLFALYLVYLLYYSSIATITMLFSILTKSSGVSLVCSLLFWILFSFISPKTATNIANKTHPYPSKLAFNNAITEDKKNGLDGHNPWNKAAKELEQNTLQEYGVETIEELPFNYAGYRMQKGEEHEAEILKKHYDKLHDIAQSQNQSYRNFSFLSPFISVRFLSMDIANTGDKMHWKFTEAAESYRIQKQAFLNNDIKDNSEYGAFGYTMKEQKFRELPKFTFSPPTLVEILSENKQNILFLFLWILLPMLMVFYVSTKKI